MFYCRQIYDDDCGFACLKMLLSHFHKSFDYIFLKNPKIKGRYSMFELMSYGNTYGINLKGYGIEPYSLSKCKLPLIALTKENNCEHYVIIDKIKKGKIHITDPKRGKYITTCDEFGLIFQNRILEVEGISKKYNIKKEKIISNVMIFEGLSYFFLQLYGIFLLYYKDCLFNLKNITICLIIYSILYFLVII